ncbi:MAG: ATP-grasp domain-containing protein [Actinoallomurus sp.]
MGLGSESTLAHFASTAEAGGVPVRVVDLRKAVESDDWRLTVGGDGAARLDGQDLDPGGAYYCRVTDLGAHEHDRATAQRWRWLTSALVAWLDHIPGMVVNRPSARSDNGSKPLHEHSLARAGFQVPESISSSSPERLRDFATAGPTIVKAISGVRASSRAVDPAELAGLESGQGPVHLQRLVRGVDVRAHVVGDRVYAERIVSTAVDYRDDDDAEFSAYELPPELANLVTGHTAELGMSFAGWDFKVGADGTHWCLEVNPMPAYDWYDRRTGGAITASLLGLLQGAEP